MKKKQVAKMLKILALVSIGVVIGRVVDIEFESNPFFIIAYLGVICND